VPLICRSQVAAASLLTVVIIAASAALPSAAAAQGVARAAVGSRTLRGEIRDSASGAPLRGAEVLVVDGLERRSRTDAEGHFLFTQLTAGRVVLRVRLIGYAPLERVLDLSRAADLNVTIALRSSSVMLESVAVTAQALPDALARVAATSTLDAQALAAGRGQTLGETIKFLPGVSVIQFGPSIAKPVIRGLNSQRVLVMNAGLRQEDQQWGTEHAPNIDSFDADQVTVVRGAGTVLYGPDAIGGVVRVEHNPVPDGGGVHGDLALNGFSNSRQGAMSLSAEGGDLMLPWIGKTGFRLRGTTRVAGNGQAPDYALSNTGFRELNGSATLGMRRSWGNADLMVSRFATELGVLRQAHVGNFDDLQRSLSSPPPDSAFSYAIGSPNQRVEHNTVRLRTAFLMENAGELELVYGFQANHRREFDNHGPLRNRSIPAFNLKLFTNALDIRWNHGTRRGITGTIGASGMLQGNQTLGKAFLIPGFDLSQVAVYAQEEYSIGRVTLSAGARTDRFSQTTIAFADAGIRSPAGTRSWTGASGSLGTEWRIADALAASVRVARAWRPPTVNERYAQGVHHGTAQYELGRPTLASEQSSGLETTIRYRNSIGSFEAAAYSNRVDGFIYLQPRQPVLTIRGTFPAFNYNQTDARLNGLELAGMVQPIGWLRLQGTANAVRGTDRTNGGPLFDMPADRLTMQARVVGSQARLGEWFIGLGGLLVREQTGVPAGTVYQLPTDGYALASLEFGATHTAFAGRHVDLSISVNNLFDTRYRDYLSRYRLFVNDTGRDVALRLRVPI
jgi:iron complex outermembrane receptor protein